MTVYNLMRNAANAQMMGRRRTAGGGWTPADISNQEHRWDLELSTLRHASNNLDYVEDLVGSEPLTSSGRTPPYYSSSVSLHNNRACAVFDSSNLERLGTTGLADSQPKTVWLIYSWNRINTDATFVGGGGRWTVNFANPQRIDVNYDGGTNAMWGHIPRAEKAYCMIVHLNGSDSAAYVNGAEYLMNSVGPSGLGGTFEFGGEWFNNHADINITMAGIVTGSMSESDRNELLSWSVDNAGVVIEPCSAKPDIWCRADLWHTGTVNYSNSSSIGFWDNLGSGSLLQSFQGGSPHYLTSSAKFNNQPTFGFDGNNLFEDGQSTAWYQQADGDYLCMYVVGSSTNTGASAGHFLSTTAYTVRGGFRLRVGSGSSTVYLGVVEESGGGTFIQDNWDVTYGDEALVAGMRFSGAVTTALDNLAFYTNGVFIKENTADMSYIAASPDGDLVVGGTNAVTPTLLGEIAEFGYFKRQLTDWEQSIIVDYLNTRYGFTLTTLFPDS